MPSPVAALTYSEGASDFGDGFTFSNMNVGTLSLGINTVDGALTGSCGALLCNTGADHYDGFVFDVDTGHEISSITLASEGNGPGGAQLSTTIHGPSPSVTYLGGINQPWSFAGPNFLLNPVGEGRYHIAVHGGSSFGGTGNFDVYGWMITLDVSLDSGGSMPPPASPVPVPASALLLGSAMLGLGLARRRIA